MIKIQNEDQVTARLESALYSAGRPLTIEELIKATGTESRQKTLAVLDLLENLIGSIANPRSRRNRQLEFEAIQPPDFKEYFVPFENLVVKYESLIIRKIRGTGSGLLKQIVADLDSLDSIRCFFAVLFLARDQKVELAQIDDDIQVTLIDDNKKGEEDGQASK